LKNLPQRNDRGSIAASMRRGFHLSNQLRMHHGERWHAYLTAASPLDLIHQHAAASTADQKRTRPSCVRAHQFGLSQRRYPVCHGTLWATSGVQFDLLAMWAMRPPNDRNRLVPHEDQLQDRAGRGPRQKKQPKQLDGGLLRYFLKFYMVKISSPSLDIMEAWASYFASIHAAILFTTWDSIPLKP